MQSMEKYVSRLDSPQNKDHIAPHLMENSVCCCDLSLGSLLYFNLISEEAASDQSSVEFLSKLDLSKHYWVVLS